MLIKDLEVVRKIRGGATRWSRSSSFASLRDVLRDKVTKSCILTNIDIVLCNVAFLLMQ
jgi:hypothetical protein